ncbi:MAG TPA: YggT family protein [Frankiaceae bacterium]|nr:YggT family protein [Frankiaceae bacterium]
MFWLLTVYLLLLVARAVLDLVRALSPSFHPPGRAVLLFEAVYTATDPPLRLLRRVIPPLRVGSVAFDLGFLLLFIVIVILRNYARQL